MHDDPPATTKEGPIPKVRFRFRFRWLIWAAVAFVYGGVAYWNWMNHASATVADVALRDTLRLERRGREGFVYAVELRVSGWLDGPASVWVYERDAHVIDGAFDLVLYSGDCYADALTVHYAPAGCTKGLVTFSCAFSAN